MSTAERLGRANEARRVKRTGSAPGRWCTAEREGKRGKRVCGSRVIQNEPERERGVFWCPRCQRYTDGSHGFGAGLTITARAA